MPTSNFKVAFKPTHFPLYLALFFSGATSLIYELLWTRIFSFSFGATSLAFAIILAVFFLGLAGGSTLAGLRISRIKNPLLTYALLEGCIGLVAALLFPVLFKLHHIFSYVNAAGTEPAGLAIRFVVAVIVLAIPTLAMGATFPVLLEYLRRTNAEMKKSVGWLYGINTLGAFFGVYLATHWLIPYLGLQNAYFLTVSVNGLITIFIWAFQRHLTFQPSENIPSHPSNEVENVPVDENSHSNRLRWIGLAFLATSGFTTLGYEIAWSRVFTITMEGSIYGVGATLGAFLIGIGLGGLFYGALGKYLKTPSQLIHAYVITCIIMTVYLAVSRLSLPVAGYFLKTITNNYRDILGLHLNFLIASLFLLPITISLGFLFPLALSIFNFGKSQWASGAGWAYGLNTLCSVTGSLLTAAYLMDQFGIQGIVLINVYLLLGTIMLGILLFEQSPRQRWLWLSPVIALLAFAGTLWPEINAKSVLNTIRADRQLSASHLFQSIAAGFSPQPRLQLYKDGVGSTLSLTLNGRSYGVQSNGLPQSGRQLDPPHFNLESSLVGLYPLLHHPKADSALVIGLGAGVTVGVLRKAEVPKVTVIELEPSMPAFSRAMFPNGESPLDDSGVTLISDDARNFLTRNLQSENPKTWPLIASQPAHPWVSGASDLFTEEMFAIVYKSLAPGGVFGQWFMPSGIDSTGFYSILNAFSKTFDEVTAYRVEKVGSGIFLVGHKGNRRLELLPMQTMLAKPAVHEIIHSAGFTEPFHFLQYTLIPTTRGQDVYQPSQPTNSDRNAWVECRMPLVGKSATLSSLKPSPLKRGIRFEMFAKPALAESLEVMRAAMEQTNLIRAQQMRTLPDTSSANSIKARMDVAEGHLSVWLGILHQAALADTQIRNTSFLHPEGTPAALRWAARILGWSMFGKDYPTEHHLDFSELSENQRPVIERSWLLHTFAHDTLPAILTPGSTVDTLHSNLEWIRSQTKSQNLSLGSSPNPEYLRLYSLWVKERHASLYQPLLQLSEKGGWHAQTRILRSLKESEDLEWINKALQKLETKNAQTDISQSLKSLSVILAARPEEKRAWLLYARYHGIAMDSLGFQQVISSAETLFPGDRVLPFRMREAFTLHGVEKPTKQSISEILFDTLQSSASGD